MFLQQPVTPIAYDRDDSSTSSTLTVDRLTKKPNKALTFTPAPASFKKSVRFCESDNKSYENYETCKEDLKELWFQGADYKIFRNCAMYMSREISKAEERNRAPFSYARVMEHTYSECCKASSDQANVLSAEETRHLVRWAEVATSRLGLEKWSIRPVGTDKSYRRSVMVGLVLDAQDRPFESDDARVHFIAESCQRITRPQRLFSRTLAEAQAAASHNQASKEVTV